MNTLLLRKWFLLSIVMGLMISNINLAMSSPTKVNKSEAIALQHYFWYDGDEKRSVWVNPALMAEFKVQAETPAQLKSRDPIKKVVAQSFFVRFLKIEIGGISSKVTGSNLNKSTSSHFSPVLHDVASASGIKRALPGNVLVQMKPDWDQEKIEAWFEANNLIAIKPLTFALNAFLIQSKPGLDSLDIANRVYETNDVLLASPNWWRELVAR